MKVVASWSGGKESCFSCYKAVSGGFDVSYLLNMISADGRCMSHGIDSELLVAQSRAVEIPVIQRPVTWNTYEAGFKDAIAGLKRSGVEGAVFGDMDVPLHKKWVDQTCAELAIKPVMPLWGLNPEHVLSSFIDSGFEAIVVMVNAGMLGEEWLGRKIDRNFVDDLLKLKSKVHLCGEAGEYHTFVCDGPLFKKRIEILESKNVARNGYWFLDISDFEITS